ncbi:MAG: LamG-like jellyroll fold domain-containing protein, partial [Mycobacteriales bacterium]
STAAGSSQPVRPAFTIARPRRARGPGAHGAARQHLGATVPLLGGIPRRPSWATSRCSSARRRLGRDRSPARHGSRTTRRTRPPATGRWYHLVAGHDANAGTDTLDVDGQPRPTVLHQDRGDSPAGPPAVDGGFSAGRATDLWPGTIDQVHGWNRVLSAADAAAPYSSGG